MKDEKNLCDTCRPAKLWAELRTSAQTKLALRMSVVATHLLGRSETKQSDKNITVEDETLKRLLINSFCVNSDALLVYKALDGKDEFNAESVSGVEYEQKGNRTECALLALAKRWKCDYEEVRRRIPVAASVPFNSAWK